MKCFKCGQITNGNICRKCEREEAAQIKRIEKIYIATSNGDYNQETVINDMELVRWELEEGCQDFVMITKKKLTDRQFAQIIGIMKNNLPKTEGVEK